MIQVRDPKSIYQIDGDIENGRFHGRWHFSFGDYYDPRFKDFGTLRVFNDDTLTPGAVWPLHPHRDNDVVTYVASGEFRHTDESCKGGILKKGWVQHTTVGRGMRHSEINNRPDQPMRFIQMWFYPSKHGLDPAVEQRAVEQAERTDRFCCLYRTGIKTHFRSFPMPELFPAFCTRERLRNMILRQGAAYIFTCWKEDQ